MPAVDQPNLAQLHASGDPGFRGEFRALLEIYRSIRFVAFIAGVHSSTVYRWIQKDPSLVTGIPLPQPGYPKGKPRVSKDPTKTK